MDFLTLFEQSLTDSDETVKQVLNSLPNAKDLLKVLLRTKQYNRLYLLLSLINKCHYELVAELVVEAIQAGQPQDLPSMFAETQLKSIVPFMSYEYGKRGLSHELPIELSEYTDNDLYNKGLIENDYADLLIMRPYYPALFGQYCSKNCMDRIGYTEEHANYYTVQLKLKM